jgi:hypothetical protein
MNQPSKPPIALEVPAQYENQEFWLVLPTNGFGDPKVRKTDPGRLSANEFALRLELRVPKHQRRVAQTIQITLPDEFTHLAKVDVSVASEGPEA